MTFQTSQSIEGKSLLTISETYNPTSGNIALKSNPPLPEPTPAYRQSTEELLAKMQGKSLDVLLEECHLHMIQLKQLEGKLQVIAILVSEERMKHFTDEKVKTYDRYHNLFISSFIAIGTVAVAAAPWFNIAATEKAFKATQLAWQGLSKGAEGVDKQFDNKDRADQTGIDFNTESVRDTKQRKDRDYQSNSQAFKDLIATMDRIADTILRRFKSFSSRG